MIEESIREDIRIEKWKDLSINLDTKQGRKLSKNIRIMYISKPKNTLLLKRMMKSTRMEIITKVENP